MFATPVYAQTQDVNIVNQPVQVEVTNESLTVSQGELSVDPDTLTRGDYYIVVCLLVLLGINVIDFARRVISPKKYVA